MKIVEQVLRPTRMALIVAATGLLPLTGHAQGVSMSEMQARYEADIQRCATLTDPESKRTCRQEAGAAIQEARRGRLVTQQADSTNATARCARLPTERQADCQRLMNDSGTVEHGSISGGGVMRELSITVPVEPASQAPTYGAQPTYQTQPVTPAPHSHGATPSHSTTPQGYSNTPHNYGTTPIR